MILEAWSISNTGLVQETNRDALGCFPEIGLFVIADGMGGHNGGDLASRLVVDVIRDSFRVPPPERAGRESLTERAARMLRLRPDPAPPSSPNDVRVPDILKDAVDRANLRVFEKSRAKESDAVTGSTVIALKFAPADRRAHWVHVGDSRLYMLRNNELLLRTADHTWFGEPYRTQPSIPLDLRHTNVLLRALGTRPEVEATLGSDVLWDRDVFLLCSDGLSSLVSASDISEQLTACAALSEAGQNLVRIALGAGGKDNISIVLVRVLSM